MKTQTETHWKALEFHCRRGNAESEVLLLSYLAYLQHQQLPTDLFARLLQEGDQVLMPWLMQAESAPRKYKALILQIRQQFISHQTDNPG